MTSEVLPTDQLLSISTKIPYIDEKGFINQIAISKLRENALQDRRPTKQFIVLNKGLNNFFITLTTGKTSIGFASTMMVPMCQFAQSVGTQQQKGLSCFYVDNLDILQVPF